MSLKRCLSWAIFLLLAAATPSHAVKYYSGQTHLRPAHYLRDGSTKGKPRPRGHLLSGHPGGPVKLKVAPKPKVRRR